MAILKLSPGQPLQISLKWKSGKEVSGRYGKQFLYTLSNRDALYLPPIAADEIRSLNLDVDEPFTILKANGAGNAVTYTVERVPVTIPPPDPKPMAQARRIDAPSRPNLTTAQSQQLFKQLVATIEAVKAAEEFSISIDRPVKFTEADVRAMAISGFIEQSRRAA